MLAALSPERKFGTSVLKAASNKYIIRRGGERQNLKWRENS
jgi:hypothetical protein